ncbi:conserved Plasmodium protein, unknown function [Plasmodium sp. gorilla clade G2]|uniref:conserved Plasmodium protein, unknown function n=1 Tax=Plasmodium sp. gorilla clade G2 TaxID=880535 RepID=UPI000D2035B7|nr:conserved Plasmodium protein, unknown function [Plasmodium sp. gorilla clade G2]SOV14506.1 conserved Plasmodium protein, unknown function [Plasmodium sp. gorilla clade G2]
MYDVICFICLYLWLLFIIIGNNIFLLCAGENLKKVECEGILIYDDIINISKKNKEEYLEGKKKKKSRDIFHIPYFIIYKNVNKNVFSSNEHYNGLSVFMKHNINTREKIEEEKINVLNNFLYKIYNTEEYRKEINKYIKNNIQNDINLYISFLKKNKKALFLKSSLLESLYKNCRSIHLKDNHYVINKNCLSHKYILFNWIDEDVFFNKWNDNMKRYDNSSSIYKSYKCPILSFIHIAKIDLIKASFPYFLKYFFLDVLKKKNEKAYNLFLFFMNNKIIKDVVINMFVDKRMEKNKYKYNDKAKDEEHKTYKFKNHYYNKYVFNISFNIYIKNYKILDMLSHFFNKFVCYHKKNNIFLMNHNNNSNSNIYIYLKNKKQIIHHKNYIYNYGIEKNLYFIPYLFLSLYEEEEEKKKPVNTFLFFNYRVENLLNVVEIFQIGMHGENDYFLYKGDDKNMDVNINMMSFILSRQEISSYDNSEKKYISDENNNIEREQIYMFKNIKKIKEKKESYKNNSLNKNIKSNIIIDRIDINMKKKDSSFLKCKMIIRDLYGNNIFIDREKKINNNIYCPFLNIENYKEDSSHFMTTYVYDIIFEDKNKINTTQGENINTLYNNNNNNIKGKNMNTLYNKTIYNNNNIIKYLINSDRNNRIEDIKIYTYDYINIYYKTLLQNRYVVPCLKKKKINNVNIYKYNYYNNIYDKDMLCSEYDIYEFSDGKIYLNCSEQNDKNKNKNIINNNNNNIWNNINDKDKEDIKIYADKKNVYIHKNYDNDMLSIYTYDFYLYLNEISFPSFFFQEQKQFHTEHICNESFLNKQENDYYHNSYNTIYDLKLVNNFIYIPNTNITEGNNHIFNIYNVYNKNKILHNVLKVNYMEKMNYPIYYDLYYNTTDFYVNNTYIYSIPRGTDNINYIFYITTSTIFLLIFITFYIFYNF